MIIQQVGFFSPQLALSTNYAAAKRNVIISLNQPTLTSFTDSRKSYADTFA